MTDTPHFVLYLRASWGEKRKFKNPPFKQATKPVNKGKLRITKRIVFGIGENGKKRKNEKQLNYHLKSISYFKIIKIQKDAKKHIDKNDRFYYSGIRKDFITYF